ncbi:hypothetical protein [Methylobacterium sp. R2-1]|uniref:hypothetical protein n=1 Tax=Methylobacterium sp. R2-1 TaxID=2587064 RepID=UPI00161D94EA|nr:hypothetical protein [Methylobacterium sp. R2-1]MBB2963764.1 hypothetical protein [Methylobacterium sp. R2-1]
MIDETVVDRSLEFATLRDHVRRGKHILEVETAKADSRMATDREYTDLKLEAAEARGEARFIELNGKLDRIIDSLSATANSLSTAREEARALRDEVRQDYRSTRTTIIVTVFSTAIALAALLMAIVTYGDAIFGRGMSVRDVVSSVVKEQAEKNSPPKSSPPQ